MAEPVIRVAVVDDQALVRTGLRTLMESEDDLELVGEAGDGRAGLQLVRATRPDVVLCDIRMPALDGLGLLAEVDADARFVDVRVVMLTTFEHFGSAPAAREPHPQLGQLTEREREIVAWVGTGMSNSEIAERLVVSPDTVRTHVSRAMIKLGARDRAQLVVFAIRSGLEAPPDES